MARKKIRSAQHLSYNPERKITLTISNNVKKQLQEIKTKNRLKSFNESIELLLNEKEK
jgi:predicted CopG family antitoxin